MIEGDLIFSTVLGDLVERAGLVGKFDLFHETRLAIRSAMVDDREHIGYLIVVEDVPVVYAGSSRSGRRRMSEHISELRRNIHPKKPLQDAYNSGMKIWAYIRLTESEDEASDLEQWMIDELHTHSWCCNEAVDARKAWVRREGHIWAFTDKTHSEETRELISVARLKYFQTHDHPMLGKKHSEESLRNFSEGAKNRVPSEAWLSSIRKAAKRNAGPKHHNARAVVIDGVEYGCVRDAADALGIKYSTVYWRVMNDHPDFVDWKLK